MFLYEVACKYIDVFYRHMMCYSWFAHVFVSQSRLFQSWCNIFPILKPYIKKGGFSTEIVSLPVDFNAALSLGVDAMQVETIGLAWSGGGASEARGRGRNSLLGCFLQSQRHRLKRLIITFVWLHTHIHTSLLFLEVNILTHSLKLNFSSKSDTVNNCK